MRIARLLVGGLLVAGVAGPASADVGGRWERRPVLVFAADAVAAERQTALLADASARDDYKLAVYVVTPDAVLPQFGAARPDADARALRDRYDVGAADFRVVLVGLDGGAKLRSETPIPLADLAATIERMPMRRVETARRD